MKAIELKDFNNNILGSSLNGITVMGSPINGQVLTATGPTEAIWSEPTGGGAGAIVLPDGYHLSGTFDSSVFGQGNLTITGNVTINGDLILVGNLTNNDGYQVTVLKDLKAYALYFTPYSPPLNPGDPAILNPSVVQQNVTIGGNLIVDTLIDFQMTPVSSYVSFIVGGNLIASSFIGNGLSDSNACNLTVLGNVLCFSISLNGGNCQNSNTAGNGGYLISYGDIKSSDIQCKGGDCDDSIALTGNKTAGNGGAINQYTIISGDVYAQSIDLSGGNGIQASAGDGGSITFSKGNYSVGTTNINGGNCNSDNENHRSGTGGSLQVQCLCGNVNASGGQRTGTISTPAVSPPFVATGGSIYAGQINGGNIYANGCDVLTSPYASYEAAQGGFVYVSGNCFADIDVRGGHSPNGKAGKGGVVSIIGYYTGSITVNGGDSDPLYINDFIVGEAGQGGLINLFGGGTCQYINCLDGNGYNRPTDLNSNYSKVYLNGNCQIYTLNVSDTAPGSSGKIYGFNHAMPYSSTPTILKVNFMPTKKTLDNTESSQTANINSYLSDSIFTFNYHTSSWYRHSGTSI